MPDREIISERGEVVCCEALDFLSSIQSTSADVVFLDPPFNLGKKYGKTSKSSDRKDDVQYLDFMRSVIEESTRILKPGAALYMYHIPAWAVKLAPIFESHLRFRHWIAISMKNGFVRGKYLYPAHYALLYYTKGDPSSFTRPKIPKPICAKCKKDLRDYGGYKKYVEHGINLSDVWEDISPVRHRSKKTRVANELPLVIPERILTISGCVDGLVIDPFAGSGTTAVAAINAGMKFLVCDREKDYCNLIVDRVQSALLSRAYGGDNAKANHSSSLST